MTDTDSKDPVLVTGGAGFIGRHVARELLGRGHHVRVLDNFDELAHPHGPRPPDPGIELVRGDLRDRQAVERALDGVGGVFHLGGVVGNGESMVNVRRACDANTVGTATLLEAVLERRDRVRRMVVASSMVVYGEGAYECPEHGGASAPRRSRSQLRARDWEPRCPQCATELAPTAIQEGQALRPTSVYGITKRDQEELALVLGEAYGLEVVVLRYMNVYGPGQALDNPYTGVAAIFAARALAGRPPLVFEDGRQLRDLVHVTDIARATVAAMHSPAAAGHAINIAGERQIRVGELAGEIVQALGSTVMPLVTGEFRFGDIRHCFASAERARGLLGFEPRIRLPDGIPALAEWVAGQVVDERGDEALAGLRELGLVA